jgi:hypothetical protein
MRQIAIDEVFRRPDQPSRIFTVVCHCLSPTFLKSPRFVYRA